MVIRFIINISRNMSRRVTQQSNIPETKITQTSYNDGEVAVKKSSGLVKVRKGQTQEEYIAQRDEFLQKGPLIQKDNFTSNYCNTELSKPGIYVLTDKEKIEKERMIHGLERLYYLREYENCLERIEQIKKGIAIPEGGLEGKKNKTLKRLVGELDSLLEKCLKRIQLENTTNLKNL
ncbi:hypothetical protein DAMA08_040610 [Martiniozyma asiatica (nom. inval.)]|nr:hypothetical protein DAMA08_040610 [Martiniozyma asiatica]